MYITNALLDRLPNVLSLLIIQVNQLRKSINLSEAEMNYSYDYVKFTNNF